MNWRLLRFGPVLNVPDVLYSRRHRAGSLTRAPETGFGSPARLAYVARRNREHEEIRRAIEAGDPALTRSLATRDCYSGDVRVEAVHLNWGGQW
jgi:DNA-binding GntR family transcriptional regulator